MARLHEYQGKAILASHGIAIPRGKAIDSPALAPALCADLGGHAVMKMQAWTTGRAALGGVLFTTPGRAEADARALLGRSVGGFPITHVLVEEKLDIKAEVFLSIAIDDRTRSPILLLAAGGGTGIEDRAARVARIPCDPRTGPDTAALRAWVDAAPVPPASRPALADAIARAFDTARAVEARSLEINPLVVTASGAVVAADCRITIDDYAVARHPELGIEIARELDHPPTALERLAYEIEQRDHRGTFFFAQMNTAPADGSRGLIGFHGAGGGGSMMSMDAITGVGGQGFTIANFCDTSGNPSPAKVYRAARIILQQPGLVGYFGSGSGVANQEQFWSAYGLAKAFWELDLDIPAVIRLGGNTEERAVEILQGACRAAGLRAPVEAYTKNDTPAKIAERFATLVAQCRASWTPREPRRPAFVGAPGSHRFAIKGGTLWIDPAAWRDHAPAITARSSGLLADRAGTPTPTLPPQDFAAKDSEMIACEVECRRDGIPGLFIALDLPG